MRRPVIVKSSTDIAAILRGERERRGWTGEELDAKIGWPDRYAAKAENPGASWGKTLVRVHGMADLWLQSLGLALVLVDREQAERMVAEAPADPEFGKEDHFERVQVMRMVFR